MPAEEEEAEDAEEGGKMKHVNLEKSKELKESGFANTEWWREPRAYGTYSDPIRTVDPGPDWIPAPVLDEILKDLSHADFLETWCRALIAPDEFDEWLYTTMRDPDAAADVWLKVKGESK